MASKPIEQDALYRLFSEAEPLLAPQRINDTLVAGIQLNLDRNQNTASRTATFGDTVEEDYRQAIERVVQERYRQMLKIDIREQAVAPRVEDETGEREITAKPVMVTIDHFWWFRIPTADRVAYYDQPKRRYRQWVRSNRPPG